jgi:hypothetical protein
MALAQFFDDIRVEITGKTILIGQYVGDMILASGALPVDRLAVLLSAKWPRDYLPQTIGVKIDVTAQASIIQSFAVPEPSGLSDKPPTPFAGVTMQAMFQLRFPPVRVGDFVDVWLQVDGRDIPAGRLKIVDQPRPELALRPPSEIGAPVSTVN